MKKRVAVGSATALIYENQGTWGLAREDARESAQNRTRGRSRDRRRVEVDGGSRLVPRRYRVDGRDVQKRRQDDIWKESCVEGPFRFIQLRPRRECRAIDIHEGDKVDEAALKDLIRAAVALNLMVKSKPKPRQAGRLASSQVPAVSPPIGEDLRRPASYAKHFGVDARELAAEARSGNAGKAAKSSLRNQNPPGTPALSLRGF